MRTKTFFYLSALMLILLVSCATVPRNAPSGAPKQPADNKLFRQSVGVGYSSERGFMGAYSLESEGPYWSVKNAFAGIYDELKLTPKISFPAGLFSFTAELPASLTWSFPDRFQYTYAGTGRASFRTRTDPRDTSPGWIFSAEGAAQANGMPKELTQVTVASLGSSEDSLYRGSFASQLAYYNALVTPGIGFMSYFDLGKREPTDLVFSWSLSHSFGSPARSIKLSGDSTLSSGEISTLLKIETGWDHWMLRAEGSTTGSYTAAIGYSF